MANKTIPQLPEQTGKTDNDLLAIVDSGETTTSKIKLSTLLAGVGTNYFTTYSGTTTEAVDTFFDYTGTPFAPNGFDANYDNLVVGWGNSAVNGTPNTSTRNNVVFGYNNTLVNNTDDRVVVGYDNSISASGQIAIGRSNTTEKGIVIGDDNSTGGNNNGGICLGILGSGNGFRHLNIGEFANSQSFGVAVGRTADTGSYGIAIGHNANNDGQYSVVINDNDNTSTGLYNAILGGKDNQITGTTSGTTIVSLNNFTATKDDMVYLPALTLVDYASYNFASDSAAATGGVELGGIYHNAGALRVRIT